MTALNGDIMALSDAVLKTTATATTRLHIKSVFILLFKLSISTLASNSRTISGCLSESSSFSSGSWAILKRCYSCFDASVEGLLLDGFNQWESISLGISPARNEILHNIDPTDAFWGNPDGFSHCRQAALRRGDWKLHLGSCALSASCSRLQTK